MKVLSFTIPKPTQDALILQEDKAKHFYMHFHQHEELQLSYVKEGEGTLIVGDAIHSYKAGDIIVLGSNLPHVFKSNLKRRGSSHMLTLFFTRDSFGTEFFNTEELKGLRSFFDKAANGFKLTGTHTAIASVFEQIHAASKLERFILFIQLLKQINSKRYQSLSEFRSHKKYNDNDGKRMSAVYEFTINNFRQEISLATIAREAAMTKNAFCKYFKKRTNKTYVSFLTELRVEEACKLLSTDPEQSIAQIAEASGFQNMSYFNRKFRQLKQQTPRAYRKKHA